MYPGGHLIGNDKVEQGITGGKEELGSMYRIKLWQIHSYILILTFEGVKNVLITSEAR